VSQAVPASLQATLFGQGVVCGRHAPLASHVLVTSIAAEQEAVPQAAPAG
jgi:hypothetical protein